MKQNPIPRFPKNSRVCFLGDSITSGSLCSELIFEYYLKKFPKDNIRIFDAGVGGGTARFGLESLEDDLYTFEPTHVIVMYCANDVGGFSGTDDEKAERFHSDMCELIDTLRKRGMTVYIGIAPYSPETYAREIHVAVSRRIAEEYNMPYVDFYELTKAAEQKIEILNEDRVHLNERGQTLMAKIFLHSQGFEGFSPEDDDFLEPMKLTKNGELRRIYNNKIRAVWLAIRNISTAGDTMEQKIERLKGRIVTWADGAWDEFCYFRAVDFIELAPHIDFYKEQLFRITDMMIDEAQKSAASDL